MEIQNIKNPCMDALLKAFRKKYAEQLRILKARARRHEILFCASAWTSGIGELPPYTSFSFEDVFSYTYDFAVKGPNRFLARIEYFEIGRSCPRRIAIGPIGLEGR